MVRWVLNRIDSHASLSIISFLGKMKTLLRRAISSLFQHISEFISITALTKSSADQKILENVYSDPVYYDLKQFLRSLPVNLTLPNRNELFCLANKVDFTPRWWTEIGSFKMQILQIMAF